MSVIAPIASSTRLFHPAVAAWFDRQFRRADAGAGAGLAGDPGGPPYADRRADRVRQDAGGVSRGDRRAGAPGPGRAPAGRNAGRLRLAAEGAVQRHPAQPGGAARRHPRGVAGAGPAGCRDPHLGAHRRHAAGRARPHAPAPAAHRRHHAGIALHPARLRIRPQDAGDHADGDRRRNPRPGAEQARRASGAVARTAGRPVRRPAAADRPVGDAEADRDDRALPGRTAADGAPDCEIVDTGHIRAPRSRAGSPLFAARSGDVGGGLDAGLRPARRLVEAHRTTLVFVNTRRMAERVARQLSERLGEAHVTAHHGSMAKEQRLDAETAAEARRPEGAGGDRVAGARHRYRRCRSGLPARLAALDREFPAARRALRPRGRRHAEGTAVPAVARRTGRMRGAARQRPPRRARSADHSGSAARRAGAADRRRSRGAGLDRGRTVRAVPPRLAVPRAVARGLFRMSCACWPRASPRAAAGAAR